MVHFIKVILLIIAFLLTILVLMQGGRTEGLSAAITGSDKLSLFATTKSRGTDALFDKITFILVALFFVFATILKFIS